MPKKRFSAEQIVTLLRQIEVLMAQGNPTPVACRDAGISLQSYYRWRKEYGGLEIDQAKRMKDLERENVRSGGMASMMASARSPWGSMPVSIAPSDADPKVCVMGYDGIVHALSFPYHRHKTGWVDASTRKRIDIEPTHWRTWTENH
jgi:putative transposase